jgi:hypothetical protein
MSYYTVRRDDSEIRVAICPKCRSADIIKTNDMIPYKSNGHLLKLCQCNVCQSYFSFDREDGMKEITKEVAENALASGNKYRCDMKPNGEDLHGHSFYILFKQKPKTISSEKYDELMGWTEKTDVQDKNFEKFLDCVPSVNTLIKYREVVANLDFDNMKYLGEENQSLFERFQ